MHASELVGIPDPATLDEQELRNWIEDCIQEVHALRPTSGLIQAFEAVTLPSVPFQVLGPEASADWRRFFLAALVGDWICYDTLVDRIDLPRFKYILSSGFWCTKVWVTRLPDGRTLPLGNASWYPIPRFVFESVLENTNGIDDRGVFLPLRTAKPEDDILYGYILNVGITPAFRNTRCSARMLHAMRQDEKRYPHASLMAVTVDEAGRKFSKLLEMERIGDIVVAGEKEALYVRKGGRSRADR